MEQLVILATLAYVRTLVGPSVKPVLAFVSHEHIFGLLSCFRVNSATFLFRFLTNQCLSYTKHHLP